MQAITSAFTNPNIPGIINNDPKGNVFCTAILYDQVLSTKHVPKSSNPKWVREWKEFTYILYFLFSYLIVLILFFSLQDAQHSLYVVKRGDDEGKGKEVMIARV